MRHQPIPPRLFIENRARLAKLLPRRSIAIVNANDLAPTNADGLSLMIPNSDLFYLTGVEQEESVLVLAPDAANPRLRAVLFVREPNPHLALWEGYKLSKEDATRISGVPEIKWLSELPGHLRILFCELDHVHLNSNEHPRATVEVQSRDARFIEALRSQYPLHDYRRLAPLLHKLRLVKSPAEVDLLRKACSITHEGFLRVLRTTRPGLNEADLEAEFAHEFTRSHARFAYNPIIASGPNACVLHYNQNDQPLRPGQLVLLDVAASYANYNADLTRTIPVSGRFSPRQRDVYQSVLRVLRSMINEARPGVLHADWQKKSLAVMTEELLRLKLITREQVRKQKPDSPAAKKYFMHGLGHSLGLDVHDVGSLHQPFAPGWVLTVEPGIYLPEEGFGIRLENDILVTKGRPIDLMADIPIEPDAIEDLMHQPVPRRPTSKRAAKR